MKAFKIKLKGILIFKIVRYRKQIKIFKERITQDVLKEHEYIDKINLLQDDIRQLTLMLPKEQKELWLKEKGKQYERYFTKKKRIKNKIY